MTTQIVDLPITWKEMEIGCLSSVVHVCGATDCLF